MFPYLIGILYALIDEKDKDDTACNNTKESKNEGEFEVEEIQGVKWSAVREFLVSLVVWRGHKGVFEEEISNLNSYPKPFGEKLFILS